MPVSMRTPSAPPSARGTSSHSLTIATTATEITRRVSQPSMGI